MISTAASSACPRTFLTTAYTKGVHDMALLPFIDPSNSASAAFNSTRMLAGKTRPRGAASRGRVPVGRDLLEGEAGELLASADQ